VQSLLVAGAGVPWNAAVPSAEDRVTATTAEPVLLVDDDVELCAMLARYLGPEGFAVTAVHDGEAGVAAALAGAAQVVVLDIGLPRLDGFGVLRRLRAASNVPVLMLTARGDDVDRIVGLELGADDYLAKPFNPRELAARLRAILRRARTTAVAPGAGPRRLAVDDLQLDPSARRLTRGGEPIELTATEFAMVDCLLRHAGEPVGRELLSETVLGRPWSPLDRSLDTHVANLRRKLGPAADGSPRIRTVRGRGYQYVLPP
jgi:two-component system response regulator CpxR